MWCVLYLYSFQDCADILKRQNVLYMQNLSTFQAYLNRNGLALVLVCLRLKDFGQASQAQADLASQCATFGASEEFRLADSILTAYSSGDADKLHKLLRSTTLVHALDAQVVRMAKKIEAPPSSGGQMTRAEFKASAAAAAANNSQTQPPSDDFLC
jgi:hypothetical protein